MTDTKQMSVQELRDILKTQYGLTEEEISSLGSKTGVAARLLELEEQASLKQVMPETTDSTETQVIEELDDDILDDVEMVEDEVEQVPGNQPTWRDPNWTEFVISQLDPSELRDGHPTVDGLRRITEVLVGDIVCVQSDVLQVPNPENENRATVKVSVVVDDRFSHRTYQMDGSADVWSRNTDPIYAKHPVATAESRAESRAYRRLLRLRNIISAEEVAREDDTGFEPFDKIQDHQIDAVERLAEKLDIDLTKWLPTHDVSVLSIVQKQASRSKGQELLKALNGLRDAGAIAEDIKGFNNTWRN